MFSTVTKGKGTLFLMFFIQILIKPVSTLRVINVRVDKWNELLDEPIGAFHVWNIDLVEANSQRSIFGEVRVYPYLNDSLFVDGDHGFLDPEVTKYFEQVLIPDQGRQQYVQSFRRRDILNLCEGDDWILDKYLSRIEVPTALAQTIRVLSTDDVLGLYNVPVQLGSPVVEFLDVTWVRLLTLQN